MNTNVTLVTSAYVSCFSLYTYVKRLTLKIMDLIKLNEWIDFGTAETN